MFAVEGWKLPNVVPQKAVKRKANESIAPPPKKVAPPKRAEPFKKSGKSKQAPRVKKQQKDKSKYTPYGKQKDTKSFSNTTPLAKERKARPKSPEIPSTLNEKVHASQEVSIKDKRPARSELSRNDREKQVNKIASNVKERDTQLARPKTKSIETSSNDFKKNTSQRPTTKLARPPKSERASTPPKQSVDIPPPFSGFSNKSLTPLQQKMAQKLSGARFRWINEKLYTSTGSDALNLIKEQPRMFEEYHDGFRQQVQSWPLNPVDVYASRLAELHDETHSKMVVLDLGCGDAALASSVLRLDPSSNLVEVKSYDLHAPNPMVTVADVSSLPLQSGCANIAIFCLSLMGTNFLSFVQEAARVLEDGGLLWVAEIKSRFTDPDKFMAAMESLGFECTGKEEGNKMFVMLDFVLDKRAKKTKEKVEIDETKIGALLKPCTYKKR